MIPLFPGKLVYKCRPCGTQHSSKPDFVASIVAKLLNQVHSIYVSKIEAVTCMHLCFGGELEIKNKLLATMSAVSVLILGGRGLYQCSGCVSHSVFAEGVM
jgi:hypothetical protein